MPQNDFIKHRIAFTTKYKRQLLAIACILLAFLSGPIVGVVFIWTLRLMAWSFSYPLLKEAGDPVMFFSAFVCIIGWVFGVVAAVTAYDTHSK